jgi:hypothetical protein
MSGASRLLLVEGLITPGGSAAAKLADIEMLVMHTGRERTEEEFSRLLASTAFGWIALCRRNRRYRSSKPRRYNRSLCKFTDSRGGLKPAAG